MPYFLRFFVFTSCDDINILLMFGECKGLGGYWNLAIGIWREVEDGYWNMEYGESPLLQ